MLITLQSMPRVGPKCRSLSGKYLLTVASAMGHACRILTGWSLAEHRGRKQRATIRTASRHAEDIYIYIYIYQYLKAFRCDSANYPLCFHQVLFDKYDADRSGKLTPDELKASTEMGVAICCDTYRQQKHAQIADSGP